MVRKRFRVVLEFMGIALVAVLVACGGGGGDEPAAATTGAPEEADPIAAIQPGVAEGLEDFVQKDDPNFFKRRMEELEGEEDPSVTQLTGGLLLEVEKPVYTEPPEMQIDVNRKYTATLEMRYKGSIVAAFGKKDLVVIELFPNEAPNTVNNFVFLARNGFYNGLSFHRIIPGFMAQGGDPKGDGTGDPGYKFDDEFSPSLRHDGPGVVSMANAGIVDGSGTNGSQFFITYSAQPLLDGLNADGSTKNCADPGVSCHTVFGRVTEGIELLEKFAARDPSAATEPPTEIINTITIVEE